MDGLDRQTLECQSRIVNSWMARKEMLWQLMKPDTWTENCFYCPSVKGPTMMASPLIILIDVCEEPINHCCHDTVFCLRRHVKQRLQQVERRCSCCSIDDLKWQDNGATMYPSWPHLSISSTSDLDAFSLPPEAVSSQVRQHLHIPKC